MPESSAEEYICKRGDDAIRLAAESIAETGSEFSAAATQAIFDATIVLLLDKPRETAAIQQLLQMRCPEAEMFVEGWRILADFMQRGGRVAFIEPQEKPK